MYGPSGSALETPSRGCGAAWGESPAQRLMIGSCPTKIRGFWLGCVQLLFTLTLCPVEAIPGRRAVAPDLGPAHTQTGDA